MAISELHRALGVKIPLSSADIPDDVVVESDIGPGAITNTEVNASANIAVTKLANGTSNQVVKTNAGGTALEHGTIDNANITNSTIEAGKIDFFKSGTITGTGTAQSTAHSLGRTPALVLVIMAEGGVAGVVTEGAHDGTNVIVTAPSGMDYKVVAL
jgi:hypothetical protein